MVNISSQSFLPKSLLLSHLKSLLGILKYSVCVQQQYLNFDLNLALKAILVWYRGWGREKLLRYSKWLRLTLKFKVKQIFLGTLISFHGQCQHKKLQNYGMPGIKSKHPPPRVRPDETLHLSVTWSREQTSERRAQGRGGVSLSTRSVILITQLIITSELLFFAAFGEWWLSTENVLNVKAHVWWI